MAEEFHQHFPFSRVVDGDEDREPFQVGLLFGGRYRLAKTELCGETEGAAFAGRAIHADVSTHGLYQLGTDGQPQPGAAVAAGGGCVGLGERFEDQFLLFGGDADAAVLDAESQAGSGG